MKEFRNVPSKLYTHAEQWVSNEKQVTQAQMKARTESGFKRPQSAKRPNMNYHEDKTANLGMFERYYYEKLKEKNLIQDEDETEEAKERAHYEKEIDKERQVENVQNIEDQLNEQYESIKKAKLKEPTPSSNDKGLLLPKTPKNYLKENKQMIHEHKIPNKVKPKEIKEGPIHKNYGKTPEYITKMKIEAEVKKEIQKKIKEESKYPKGTRLLSEEERLMTLNGLYESQKEIVGLIEKLPITLRTMASKNRKDELEKKLDEIEEAIKTFSRKQVFIKVDS